MSVEHESEVDVHNDYDGGDHEKSLEDATWKNWALIEVGFAVLLIFFISLIALVLCFVLFFGASDGSHPLLRHPAKLAGERNVVSENVLVHDQVGDENPWHAQAE